MFKHGAIAVILTVLGGSILGGCEQGKHQQPKSDHQLEPKSCLNEVLSTVSLAAGSAQIGSDKGYPEERPVRTLDIAAFNMDATEVTNGQFARFVNETGYVTSAEKIQPGFEVSGAAVFTPPNAKNHTWWRFLEGANSRQPEGPESSIEGRNSDPVVQVSHIYQSSD